jgi:uncharacterized tellurite resistance protein B-like protein
MFESLKAWFQSVDNDSKLFIHADEEAIHVALASLLYHIISSNYGESEKEKHEFSKILIEEFELNNKQVTSLYKQVKKLKSDLTNDLETVNHYLKRNPNSRMIFMKKLNHLISLDGMTSEELEIFYNAQRVLFPEISDERAF